MQFTIKIPSHSSPTPTARILPFGESYVDQRSSGFGSRYQFSAKEKDAESGYHYFGARYYDSDLSVWLGVDPMEVKYPDQSPYSYCGNRPVNVIDPYGMDEWEVIRKRNGKVKFERIGGMGGDETQIVNYSIENEKGEHVQARKPEAFEGSREELRDAIKNDNQWKLSTTTKTKYDPTAAYAFDDAMQLLVWESAKFAATGCAFKLIGVFANPILRTISHSWSARVAAKTGGNLALRSDIILSGGRSGQFVKNLTGPANSVLKGSGNRIFITDDAGKVIWDITRDRAKSVVPGQGFGPKVTPTQQQLDLLNKIWGN